MGHVYLATNEDAMPGLVKIGQTDGDVQERMKELFSPTGVAGKFVCKCSCEVQNSGHVEKQLHKLFIDYRYEKEFFKMNWLSVAVTLLALAVAERNDKRENPAPPAMPVSVEGRQQKYVTDKVEKKSIKKMDNERGGIYQDKRRSDYVDFVFRNVTPAVARADANALDYLSENYLDGSNVYNITNIAEAKEIKKRLLKNGDLHKVNVDYGNSIMGAAMGQYVKFLRWEQGKE